MGIWRNVEGGSIARRLFPTLGNSTGAGDADRVVRSVHPHDAPIKSDHNRIIKKDKHSFL